MLDEILFITASLIALIIIYQLSYNIVSAANSTREYYYVTECEMLYNATKYSGAEWIILLPYPFNGSSLLRVRP